MIFRVLGAAALAAMVALAFALAVWLLANAVTWAIPAPGWDCPDGTQRYVRLSVAGEPQYSCFRPEDAQ